MGLSSVYLAVACWYTLLLSPIKLTSRVALLFAQLQFSLLSTYFVLFLLTSLCKTLFFVLQLAVLNDASSSLLVIVISLSTHNSPLLTFPICVHHKGAKRLSLFLVLLQHRTHYAGFFLGNILEDWIWVMFLIFSSFFFSFLSSLFLLC